MSLITHLASTARVTINRWDTLTAFCFRRCRHTLFLSFSLSLFLLSPVFAQRHRPQLHQPQRSQYAGRILLLPADGHPVSWKLPRMIARIADHEVLYPPREFLGDGVREVDAERVIAWAKKQNFDHLNGVLVALDAFAGGSNESEPNQTGLAFINWVRQRKPNLPIYGFTQKTREEPGKLGLDDLLLTSDNHEAAYLLVARFLNRTYQRPLKIQPVLAMEPPPAVLSALTSCVDAIGGQLVKEKADVLLFLRAPKMDEAQEANFAEALAKALAAGYYVALADYSGDPEPLLTALRARKQLDALQAYAAAAMPEQAIGKAIAHCSARLIAAKVLRRSLETDQWQRAERMHVELMMTRYLEDWGYPHKVRPLLETHVREQLQADPAKLGTATEAAEAFLSHEIKLLADELFRTQFRYNVHSVLLADGTRADFQPELLQRCKARLPLQRTNEIELDVGVHLPQLIGINPLPTRR